MGIPAFYRWLVDKYPLAVVDVKEEEAPTVVNGVSVPVDASRPNPNGFEFDNLYLDMNGIIHPCFHPEDFPAPNTYDEVFKAVFKSIDRIFSLIRPRKLLYLAIDGVAPRAKMNQQRARRFRAAKEAADEEQTDMLDSNVITPGTEFMALLSSALQFYLHLRMNTYPGWRGVKVILSDASVPGEGEHKIMAYIRLQRNLPGFDPNTRHCLYGLDADLIMLALATHEIHFSILREDGSKHTNDRSPINNRQNKRRKLKQGDVYGNNLEDHIMRQKFQFLHVWILRDYLVHDLKIPDPTVKADLERLIDDLVFMCMFVGNDFLPHVPSLEISEGAIDLLMAVYKKEFVRMGGYLTNSFEVNLERVEHFVRGVGSHENVIFRKRSQVQKERGIRFGGPSSNSGVKKIRGSINHVTDVANPVTDQVKLGEVGWKERFYADKFEAKTNDERERIRRDSVLKYIEGICWAMHYYYQGVCSWQWFYPYHYAPFASDIYGLNQLEIHFILGKPFKPFDQLMGVLPAASAHALPSFYRELMTDSSSPISDFYPSDFEIDLNGKRFSWQGVCKLPFIEESRLLSETAKVEHTLTDEEKRRNSLGMDMLFVHKSHPLSKTIFPFYKRNNNHSKLSKAKVKKKINPEVSAGMNGYVYISDKPLCSLEIDAPINDMAVILKNEVVSVFYKCPSFHSHIPKPPNGVNMPGKSVSKQDVLPPPVLWHEKSNIFGRVRSERPIPKSISGPHLAKLSHQLVRDYYPAKRLGSHGCLDVGNHIRVDDLAFQSNLKETIFGKELNGSSEKHIAFDRTAVYPAKRLGSHGCLDVGNHICVDHLAFQSNLKETICGKELDGSSEKCIAFERTAFCPRKWLTDKQMKNRRRKINLKKRKKAAAEGGNIMSNPEIKGEATSLGSDKRD
ncbi:5'-3' exoribonuclease 3-like isoform X1 [Actinidia eriantha]|uniref:5'-3' exoribonuclease 3-like isoform X1 n=1 Tax=Actinidia eriantha TaxID=165200 RepID=UPI00258347CB|nr:5'-3' exoribonuclease 3-like isoform X1 [Actinidia eriantha]